MEKINIKEVKAQKENIKNIIYIYAFILVLIFINNTLYLI